MHAGWPLEVGLAELLPATLGRWWATQAALPLGGQSQYSEARLGARLVQTTLAVARRTLGTPTGRCCTQSASKQVYLATTSQGKNKIRRHGYPVIQAVIFHFLIRTICYAYFPSAACLQWVVLNLNQNKRFVDLDAPLKWTCAVLFICCTFRWILTSLHDNSYIHIT